LSLLTILIPIAIVATLNLPVPPVDETKGL
jgi:hypothetical protein